jgi:LAO/AO transport system ATPase
MGRAITAIEDGRRVAGELVASLAPRAGAPLVVGVTGPPGAGKSTLVARLAEQWSSRGVRTGLLLVDPSSPLSGGAVLGDRVRLRPSRDPLLFVRSLAARGHLGGVTRMTPMLVTVLGAAGTDVVVLETVGTGQSETEVALVADVTVLVLPPGLGDEIQAIKAGTAEVADVLVVNKADLAGAERAEVELTMMVGHSARPERPVLCTVALSGEGVDVLVGVLDRARSHEREQRGQEHLRQVVRATVEQQVGIWLAGAGRRRVEELAEDVRSGSATLGQATANALDDLSEWCRHW